VDGGGDGEDGFLGAPVAGLGAGPATVFLPVVDLGRFGDGEADPAGGPGRGQSGGCGLFDGDVGLMRVFGLARRAPIAARPASIRAARAWASRAALLLECTQITR